MDIVDLLAQRRQPGVKNKNYLQWTHLQLISFAIAPVVRLLVVLLKSDVGGAIANESTVVVQGVLCEQAELPPQVHLGLKVAT